MNRRDSARTWATWIATLGVLVMSTGFAVMASAGSAAAVEKVIVCHATNSDSTPYQVIVVDDNSVQLEAHQAHAAEPNKIWKEAGTFNGVDHEAGEPKPDLIGVDSESVCLGEVTPPEDLLVAVDVVFVDPSCENQNAASYTVTGDVDDVTVAESAAPAPGATITVTATVKDGFTFADDAQQYSETHTFGPAFDLEGEPCVVVEPPIVEPPVEEPPVVTPPVVAPPVVSPPASDPPAAAPPAVTPPSVVKAGLGSATPIASDAPGQQGLALVLAGMLLLICAGALGMVRPTGAGSRI